MSSLTLDLVVSEKIQDQVKMNGEKQLQATVSHSTVLSLLGLASLPSNTVLSRKRGVQLDITVVTPKGTEVVFRQGDTHALWFGHQVDQNAKQLLAYAAEKGSVSFPVKSVAVVQSNAKVSKAVSQEEMGDCPI